MNDIKVKWTWHWPTAADKSDVVRVVQLIETNIERRGTGSQEDPIRRIRQLWDFEGNLVAEHDPLKDPR